MDELPAHLRGLPFQVDLRHRMREIRVLLFDGVERKVKVRLQGGRIDCLRSGGACGQGDQRNGGRNGELS